MKEATGEVSMTVIVLIAVAIISALLVALMPVMGNFIKDKWQQTTEGELDQTKDLEFDME